ncbi:hypothetical protein [Flavobacterium sp. SM2513]|uniref:hypothetical protein n=1 Tax=Flavobacterium sp. SM2513 TaxID=3424766 RepID=UPI003D7F7497
MELVIFIIAVVFGLVVYFYSQKVKNSKNLERNYYYKRFLRNKLQSEKNIKQLGKIIEFADGDYFIMTRSGIIDLQKYHLQLQSDYLSDYSAAVLKKIKNNNLKRKDRKRHAKMLINQSEKLYNTEVNIAQFQLRLKEVNYISV